MAILDDCLGVKGSTARTVDGNGRRFPMSLQSHSFRNGLMTAHAIRKKVGG